VTLRNYNFYDRHKSEKASFQISKKCQILCLKQLYDTRPPSHIAHITWFSQHRNAASQRGGGEGLRLQSQRGQDLCAAAAAEHLIFKTSTEEQTVDLTNKGMRKDSQIFSRTIAKISENPF
jgi:hypothetical protein